jgi:hypothetical protein
LAADPDVKIQLELNARIILSKKKTTTDVAFARKHNFNNKILLALWHPKPP